MLCYVILYYIVLYYVMLCYIILYYIILYYIILYKYTRGMSKVSSGRLNFARKVHETVARAHSYFANIPEGVRDVLIAVSSSSSTLELLKYGKAH